MMRRWPLLLSLLPLLLGLAVYGQYWRGWAAQFETTLAGWFPGQRPEVSGFPYRLETELVRVELAHDGGVKLAMAVNRLRLNRGPWRPELTVLQGQTVVLSATVAGLTPRVFAGVGTASLKLDGERLARLSLVLPKARGNAGLGAGVGPEFSAERLELHLREIAAVADPVGPPVAPPLSQRLSSRGQLVVGAAGFKSGRGAAISLAGEMQVRGPGRLDDFARWASGGGSADAVLTGSDATGELFKFDGTVVPLGGGLQLAGTITTICPLAVQAALNGSAPPAEQRLRVPVLLALEISLPANGAVALSGIPADLATRARRGQVPACPRLG